MSWHEANITGRDLELNNEKYVESRANKKQDNYQPQKKMKS